MKKIKKKKTWAEYECIDQYNKDLSNPYSSINTALKITPNELSLCPLLCKQVKTLVFSTAKCKMSAVARRILRICSFCACGVREKKTRSQAMARGRDREWQQSGKGRGYRSAGCGTGRHPLWCTPPISTTIHQIPKRSSLRENFAVIEIGGTTGI